MSDKKKKKKKKKAEIIKVNKARHMVITPVLRLSFPNLFIAKAFQDKPNERKTFSCDLIADSEKVFSQAYKGKKTTTVSLAKAIRNCKIDQWGEDESDWPEFEHDNIIDGNDRTIGDTEDVLEGYENKFFIVPRSGEEYPPTVMLKNGKPATDKDIYGGCLVRAQILCRPYDTGSKQGVSLRLLSVIKDSDGEKFGIGTDLFDIEESDEEEGEDWETEDDDDI